MKVIAEFFEASTIHGLSYIASSRSFVKPLWITIVVACFTFAGILIHQSFQSWEESPIKTTVQTLPISEISFPKVTVCPPKNTFTNLNYDLLMAENLTFEDETRIKLIEKALETLDYHFVQETKTNFTQVEQKSIFFNWYNGYTKIEMPFFDSDINGLTHTIHTTSTEGTIETKYFRQAFDKSKLNRGMKVKAVIYVPENIRENSSITLMAHFKMEKFANLKSFSSYDYMDFNSEYYGDQGDYEVNVTLTGKPYYEFRYKYRIDNADFQNLNLSKMPGFNLQWKFSIDVNADRKYHVADHREYDGDFLYTRAFIR